MKREQRTPRWKLAELAERADVSARTVRYYVQRGLVPAPEFRGPETVYGADHLARLRAIRALQARHLPLDAIHVALSSRTPAEVARIAEGEVPAALFATPPLARSADHDAALAEGEGFTRYTLAPGLELHIHDTASPRVRALADALRREAAQREGTR